MSSRKARIALWAGAIVCFGGCLSCCLTGGSIVIPAKDVVWRSAEIGADSSSPLQVGVAKRGEVLERFGKPSYQTPDNRAFGYLFASKVGTRTGLLFGPCATPYIGSIDAMEMDDVWIEFDETGRTVRVEKHLLKQVRGTDEDAWFSFKARMAKSS